MFNTIAYYFGYEIENIEGENCQISTNNNLLSEEDWELVEKSSSKGLTKNISKTC